MIYCWALAIIPDITDANVTRNKIIMKTRRILLFGLVTLILAGCGSDSHYKKLAISSINGDSFSLKQLHQDADKGSHDAQNWLGFYYHIEGQYVYGGRYLYCGSKNYGSSESKNHIKANQRLRKAAGRGNASAEYKLGLAYYHGWGVPKNYAKANHWFRKAADQGDAKAERSLGENYDLGIGVPTSNIKALYWYHKAADQGYAKAERSLGTYYTGANSVPNSMAKAFYWYRKAADQGDAEAGDDLGFWYTKSMKPLGLQKNYSKSFYWYHKAAESAADSGYHNINGMSSTSKDYYLGRGVPQSYSKAEYWWHEKDCKIYS
jgi:TPR repeat protein